jgi:hypothetical protein
MKRALILIIMLGLLALPAFARDGEAEYEAGYSMDRHAFGIHFGNVSGNGYAYRFVEKDWGVQAVAGGFSTGSNKYSFPDRFENSDSQDNPVSLIRTDNGRKYSINLGVNGILPLKRMENIMFYAHAGMCWFYSTQKRYHQLYTRDDSITDQYSYYYDITGEAYSSNKTKSYVNIGAGPGVEVMVGKYFRLSLELPVTYTGKDEFIMYIPQAGLYYYFK